MTPVLDLTSKLIHRFGQLKSVPWTEDEKNLFHLTHVTEILYRALSDVVYHSKRDCPSNVFCDQNAEDALKKCDEWVLQK